MDFLNVSNLRAESELEEILSSQTNSSVLSRWERKSLKAAAASSGSSADRFIPSRYVQSFIHLIFCQV